jgi:hypothetical protein
MSSRRIAGFLLLSLAVAASAFQLRRDAVATDWCSGYVCQEWAATYDVSPQAGNAPFLAVSSAGNVYVAGSSAGAAGNYVVAKYDAGGNQQWTAEYDGPIGGIDEATAIAVDDFENVYVTGWSESTTGHDYAGRDYATVKYDSSGNRLWVARYDGPVSDRDEAKALAVDASGNVYVTGTSVSETSFDFATVKYDSGGNQKWVMRYDSSGLDDYGYAVGIDSLDNVYVTGFSDHGPGGPNGATVKYDGEGGQVWAVGKGGKGIGFDSSNNVYVVAAGFVASKYDAGGDEIWTAHPSDPYGGMSDLYAATVDASGSTYITGNTEGAGGDLDYTTVKYDTEGNQAWVATYNDPWNGSDYARDIAVDSAGNVYVTGYSGGFPSTGADYATVKYDSEGNEVWVGRYDVQHDFGNALALSSGYVYVAGYSHFDYAIVKYSEASTPWPTFTPRPTATPTATPTFTPTPLPGHGHSIYYNASEFPGCSYPGPGVPSVVLSPLGWANPPSFPDGVFDDVPDGNYVLMPEGCNLFGCWIPAPVTVAGSDVSVTICMGGDPAATPTPTSTSDPAPVGGIADPPDDNGRAADGSGFVLPAAVGAVAMLAVAGWYTRRRYVQRR